MAAVINRSSLNFAKARGKLQAYDSERERIRIAPSQFYKSRTGGELSISALKKRKSYLSHPSRVYTKNTDIEIPSVDNSKMGLDCVSTGLKVECVLTESASESENLIAEETTTLVEGNDASLLNGLLETLILISPFFFWGTAMVAMKA